MSGGLDWVGLLRWSAVGWLLVIADIDRRTGRIPNALVLPGVAVAAVVSVAAPTVGLAALVAAGPYMVAFSVGLCGAGDVKLAVPCGALLGDPALALGAVLGAALVSALACGVARRRELPHAPALVAATTAVLVVAHLA